MPNWVKNRVTFNCDEETWKKICDTLLTKGENGHDAVDFDRIIPQPEFHGDEWYDWRCAHWGCKWNATSTVVLAEHEILFETPWHHPSPVIAKLAEMFPDAEIDHFFADEFPLFVGYDSYSAGEMCASECWDDDHNGIYEECWGFPLLREDDDEIDLEDSVTDALRQRGLSTCDEFVKAIVERVQQDADTEWNYDDITIAIRNELNDMIHNKYIC